MKPTRKRRSTWDLDKDKIAAAEAVLRESRTLSRDPDRLLRAVAEGKHVRLPIRSETNVVASLFASLDRGDAGPFPLPPDAQALRDLVTFCRSETDLLTDQEASRFADALLALSAHHGDWVRPLDAWRARSHNARRQFHSLLRHLIATYDVPTFLDAAWLEGLTPEGVKHQGWYKHVARGRNIRTADDLPYPLTKRQAQHFLRAPDDLDIPSAFRWALVIDLGGDERLVRSILGTRIGTAFGDEAFWASVVRFFIAHPGLEPARHGPIIDFLHDQKFVAVGPQPARRPAGAAAPGPAPAPPEHEGADARVPATSRRGLAPRPRGEPGGGDGGRVLGTVGLRRLRPRGGDGRRARVYAVTELLTARELFEEGKAMGHCVASYAPACASGRSSIWSLRMRIESGRVVRMATVEVRCRDGTIVQVRRRSNKPPTVRELSMLGRWGDAGGPRLAHWWTT